MQQLEDNFKRFSRRVNLPINKTNFSTLNNLNEVAWIFATGEKSIAFRIDDIEDNFPDFLSMENEAKKFRAFSYYPARIPPNLQVLINVFGDKIDPKWAVGIKNLLIMSETESGLKTFWEVILIEIHWIDFLNSKTYRKNLLMKILSYGSATPKICQILAAK